ncbi:MAG: hypothetical protein WCA35_24435 [Kovacikia sp.]
MEPLAGGNAPTPPLILCPNQTGDSYSFGREGVRGGMSQAEWRDIFASEYCP